MHDRASRASGPAARAGGSMHDARRVAVVCCGSLTLLVVVVAGPVLGVAAGIGVATAAALLLAARSARAAAQCEQELVTALHLLAAELASGALPESALRAAADACPAYRAGLHDAADAAHRGDRPEFAAPPLVPLGRAWRVAADTGAPLAEVVDRVAADLSAGIALRRDVTAAVAGARSSAFLLAVLPVLGLLLGAAMQADPLHVLLDSPAGRLLCLLGVVLDAAGLAWTHRLSARAQRA